MVFMGTQSESTAASTGHTGSGGHSKSNGGSPPVVDLEDSNETSNGAAAASSASAAAAKPNTRDSRDSREESGSENDDREGQIRVGKDYQVNPTNYILPERKMIPFLVR